MILVPPDPVNEHQEKPIKVVSTNTEELAKKALLLQMVWAAL